MTDQQAIQKMKEDLKLRGLVEGAFKNYARNVRKFLAFCNPRILCVGRSPRICWRLAQRWPRLKNYLVTAAFNLRWRIFILRTSQQKE